MLAVQSQSPVRVLSTEAAADAATQAGKIFHYLPTPGMGATPGQPKNWPTIWSTAAEFDLMSRLATLPAFTPPVGGGLGDVASDIAALLQSAPDLLQKGVQIINKAGPQLDAVLAVVQDPVFPQIVDRLKTLQSINDAASGATQPATPVTPGSTGLNRLVPLLDTAIFIEKHPTAKFASEHPILVGVGATVLAIGLGAGVGYGISHWKKCRVKAAATPAAMGRRRRRRR